MKLKLGIGVILAVMGLWLTGCQSAGSNDSGALNQTEAVSGTNGSSSTQESSGTQESSSTNESNTNHVHDEEDDHNHDHDHEHNHDHNHGHNHDHDEEAEAIYKGFFEDSQVQNRTLSDWEGDWQSVYPYLLDGTLDEVFAHKAEDSGKMTAEEYKEYYDVGYKTDTERIVIEGDTVTFFTKGQQHSGKYQSDGYEILTYEAGNRGVRYIFKSVEEVEGLPRYIQFSDHRINPSKSDHFHLYWGDDRKALLEEVTNWPTYYPSDMDGHSIAHEMMAH
ncbi:metal-binding protein [Paenibacillus ihbetae]|uniref:Metal-binding protein n=1 Tax=Paenibacillus ihbetae TaxID=1870820 RepID=A0A1B2E892_9BACL|nr:metal-binding protein ZinT [Paenibacillus ihbetae]ANY76190.1 metal-binding protein [Paenibacillus ihbetae]